jgi:hypothetical protein
MEMEGMERFPILCVTEEGGNGRDGEVSYTVCYRRR